MKWIQAELMIPQIIQILVMQSILQIIVVTYFWQNA